MCPDKTGKRNGVHFLRRLGVGSLPVATAVSGPGAPGFHRTRRDTKSMESCPGVPGMRYESRACREGWRGSRRHASRRAETSRALCCTSGARGTETRRSPLDDLAGVTYDHLFDELLFPQQTVVAHEGVEKHGVRRGVEHLAAVIAASSPRTTHPALSPRAGRGGTKASRGEFLCEKGRFVTPITRPSDFTSGTES